MEFYQKLSQLEDYNYELQFQNNLLQEALRQKDHEIDDLKKEVREQNDIILNLLEKGND